MKLIKLSIACIILLLDHQILATDLERLHKHKHKHRHQFTKPVSSNQYEDKVTFQKQADSVPRTSQEKRIVNQKEANSIYRFDHDVPNPSLSKHQKQAHDEFRNTLAQKHHHKKSKDHKQGLPQSGSAAYEAFGAAAQAGQSDDDAVADAVAASNQIKDDPIPVISPKTVAPTISKNKQITSDPDTVAEADEVDDEGVDENDPAIAAEAAKQELEAAGKGTDQQAEIKQIEEQEKKKAQDEKALDDDDNEADEQDKKEAEAQEKADQEKSVVQDIFGKSVDPADEVGPVPFTSATIAPAPDAKKKKSKGPAEEDEKSFENDSGSKRIDQRAHVEFMTPYDHVGYKKGTKLDADASRVTIDLLHEGHGTDCQMRDIAAVHWKTYLTDGTLVEDSRQRYGVKHPKRFQIGNYEVPKCWHIAVQQLMPHSRSKVSCPAELAKGGNIDEYNQFDNSWVHQGSDLIYELDIVDCGLHQNAVHNRHEIQPGRCFYIVSGKRSGSNQKLALTINSTDQYAPRETHVFNVDLQEFKGKDSHTIPQMWIYDQYDSTIRSMQNEEEVLFEGHNKNVIAYATTGIANEKWRITKSEHDEHKWVFTSLLTGRALDFEKGPHLMGANVITEDADGSQDQEWRIAYCSS